MTYEWLVEIIEAAGYEAQSYSGRYMYGKRCVSLKSDEGETKILANLVEECDDTREAAELIRRCRTDSMGRGIVLYWPIVAWAGSSEEEGVE